jgi:DNA polymerase III subunit alpha
MPNFVHLRLHTEYSLVDGVVRVPELMEAVAAAGMPAVALTDACNLFAMVKFFRAAQAQGIKPVIGVDVLLRESGERVEPTRLTLLCQNLAGYRNLTQLLSRAYLEGQRKDEPLFERAWLTAESTRGLIALSGAQAGGIGRALAARRTADARRILEQWLDLFGNRFYVELQRVGRSGEEEYIGAALELITACPAPVVATNDVRFIRREDFESHEARVCIHDGRLLDDATRPRRYTEQQYLRSPAEMTKVFEDLPEALDNTVEIARRCSLELRLGESRLPEYPVPEGFTTSDYARAQARQGLEARLAALPADAPIVRATYERRLETELDVICKMGFAGYFLIVADFIRWARRAAARARALWSPGR